MSVGRCQDLCESIVVSSSGGPHSRRRFLPLPVRTASSLGGRWDWVRKTRQFIEPRVNLVSSKMRAVVSSKMQRVAKAPSNVSSVALNLLRTLSRPSSRSLSGPPGFRDYNVAPKAWVPTPLVTETVVCFPSKRTQLEMSDSPTRAVVGVNVTMLP